jgi:DNA topoisomerase-3
VIYIAEKPNVAVNISKALGATTRKDGYFEGNGCIVTFAIGHLLELKDSVDYDPSMKRWSLDKFPFIPKQLEYKVRHDKKKKDKPIDKGAEKQLRTIKSLVDRKDVVEVINCCDFDREGQIIFEIINAYIGNKKPVKRILLNEWTPAEIKSAIAKMKPNSNFAGIKDAGLCRQHSDWLLGINFTSASTLQYIKGRGKYPLSIGRVITPTLKLIYDRDMEILNFIPKEYFELKAVFDTAKGKYNGYLIWEKSDIRFNSLNELINIKTEISNKDAVVAEKKVTNTKQYAPTLFNLNDLEGYITSKYSGWTADKVDDVIQVLYEGKGNGGFVSYPRTKSRHLEDTGEFVAKTKNVFDTLKNGLAYESELSFHRDKRVFDSSKVDGHGAIIPTYIIPTGLTKDEQLVYDAIVKRFLAQFMPPAEYENTEIITKILGTPMDRLFLTKGRILTFEGWKKVYGKVVNDESEEGEENLPNLPPINQGDRAKVYQLDALTKKTEPPKHFTQATLFKAMETCGKKIKNTENGELDEVMLSSILSGYEIGTPATRSDTLLKMRTIGYVELKNKSLRITELGKKLMEVFPVSELMDLDFTGRLEKTLSDIEKGKFNKEDFMKVIKDLTVSGVEKIKKKQGLVAEYPTGGNASSNSPDKIIGVCPDPQCGKPIIEGTRGYGCSGYKEGCKFVIWKNSALLEKFKIKQLDRETAKALLENHSADIPTNSLIIHAKLVKNDEGYKVDFEVTEGEVKSLGNCPICGKGVIEKIKAYSCEDSNCGFFMMKDNRFTQKYNKNFTVTILKSLLKNGEAKVTGLTTEDGKIDGTVKIQQNGKFWNLVLVDNNDSNSNDSNKPPNNNSSSDGNVIGKCLEEGCVGDVIEVGGLYKCSKEGCGFVMYKNDKFLSRYKKQITPEIATGLLADKRIHVTDLYSEGKQKYFNSDLLIAKNGKYWNISFDFGIS